MDPEIAIVFEEDLLTASLFEDAPVALEKKTKAKRGEKKEPKEKNGAGEGFDFFALSNAIQNRDKKQAWVWYQKSLMAGIPPEKIYWRSISWKVKKMMQSGYARGWTEQELVEFSFKTVSAWHEAHRSEFPLELLLEELVLSL